MQATQHFLELDLQRIHQLRYFKTAKKARKAEVKKLITEVSGLRDALASKERELTDLKGSYITEVDSFKEQIASLNKAADPLSTDKEEANKVAKDRVAEMERLQDEHSLAILQLKETHTAEISRLRGDYAIELSRLKEEHGLPLIKISMRLCLTPLMILGP